MKTKIFILLIIQILLFSNLLAQTDDIEIVWEKTYGGAKFDFANSVIQTDDGGFLFVGNTNTKNNLDIWIVKIDNNGNIQWDKTFGGSEKDEAETIISTSDGNFLIVGQTESKGSGNSDIWLIKINKNGNILWDKTFIGNAKSVIETNDDCFLVAGSIFKSTGWHALLIKTDKNGNKLWDYTTIDSGEIKSIILAFDTGYLLVGSKSVQESRGFFSDAWILKIDEQGNKLWDKTFGDENSDYVNSIVYTSNQEYLIAGISGQEDFWLIKIDQNGNKLWEKTFGGDNYDIANSLILTPDSGFLVVGRTDSKGVGAPNCWLIKIDSKINKLWDITLGGKNVDYWNTIIATKDGGYLIAGETASKGSGQTDAWLIKIKDKNNSFIDNTNPTITVSNPTTIYQITQNSQFTIKGTVADDTEISKFKINNNPINLNGSNFSYNTQLSTGQNIFNLIATDNSGNTTTKQITIDYQPQQIDNTPPQITITEPDVYRGFKLIVNKKQITITGQATDVNGIYEVLINGEDANIDINGNFSKTIYLAVGENTFTVKATDIKQNSITEEYSIIRKGQDVIVPDDDNQDIVTGKYYALIIGNNSYQDNAISSLDEPVNDAIKLYNVLTTQYTFETQNVTFLKNATYVQMIEAFDNLRETVTENDNVLIFYAGHGWWDEEDRLGYWFPVDAKQKNTAFWLPNGRITDYIGSIKSKHTLLITDACFSGSIFKTRRAFNDANQSINKLYELPSRTAMTSGNLKEVPDKSIFLDYLIKGLENNKQKYIAADALFLSFRDNVMNNSDTEPQFGTIQKVGDERGEFIFIRRDK